MRANRPFLAIADLAARETAVEEAEEPLFRYDASQEAVKRVKRALGTVRLADFDHAAHFMTGDLGIVFRRSPARRVGLIPGSRTSLNGWLRRCRWINHSLFGQSGMTLTLGRRVYVLRVRITLTVRKTL